MDVRRRTPPEADVEVRSRAGSSEIMLPANVKTREKRFGGYLPHQSKNPAPLEPEGKTMKINFARRLSLIQRGKEGGVTYLKIGPVSESEHGSKIWSIKKKCGRSVRISKGQ